MRINLVTGATTFSVRGQTLQLLPQRAIFWQEENTLLISDFHLGKASSFRKGGIPIPTRIAIQDVEIFSSLIQSLNARRCILLGDLFHNDLNQEWDLLAEWRERNPTIEMSLVKGNHDRLSDEHYEKCGIKVHPHSLSLPPFFFCHDPNDSLLKQGHSLYRIAGHLHPAVRLAGKAHLSLILPCFYFSKELGILPAFGSFTGNCVIHPQKQDSIFVLTPNEVIEV